MASSFCLPKTHVAHFIVLVRGMHQDAFAFARTLSVTIEKQRLHQNDTEIEARCYRIRQFREQ